MSAYAREFCYLRAELARYESCDRLACSDEVAYTLWWRVKTRAECLIQTAAI